ncbi:hypothetical protein [Actinoplanes rectilineatus]|uniref:hypothetical protein n=1 Tax=Actinoplanes rectilineatus TaxID=113571 RepID=UPI0005F2A320|nr:hypothetical protein [Actinoplanes rectilineatus]
MSSLAYRLDKQFVYQRTIHATSGDPQDLAVTVDHLTDLIAAQTRQDPDRVRRHVKVELERRADTGELLRWADVFGASLRADRADHYFLPQKDTA